jgi:HAD superfamily phosphatase (TIGR01668 family)
MPLATLLQPDLILGGSILTLSPELLLRHHLKGLILDVDDTLVPLRQAETDPELTAWMDGIKQVAQVWLVSNNVNAYRINRIASGFDVPYMTGAGKPSRRKLRQALTAMQLPVEQVAMVGDRLFTDVLAGNRIGMVTILVEPMVTDGQAQNHSPLRSLETLISQYLGVTLSQPGLEE